MSTILVIGPTLAHTPADQIPPVEQADAASGLVYKPPMRGAPEGRVGGGSRGTLASATPLPRIDVLAPANHFGFTADTQPTVYFFISQPVQWPVQFTIAEPLRPPPILEVTIAAPRKAGLYALPLNSYGVRLRPGIVYTWSISILLDARAWSHNIVASAPIVYDPALSPIPPAPLDPVQRAVYFADKGLWYDAITAAVDAQRRGRNSALEVLLRQGGLSDIATNATAH